jgi:poly(hydroxyalkanoate) granule-associated protein
MVTRTQNRRAPRAVTNQDIPRKLFLAGLGAVSLAQKKGTELLDTLAEEGQSFKVRAEKYAATVTRDARRAGSQLRREIDRKIAPIQKQALRTAKQIEAGVSRQVGDVLTRLGVPSRADVQELIGRVGGLKRKVQGTRRKRAA